MTKEQVSKTFKVERHENHGGGYRGFFSWKGKKYYADIVSLPMLRYWYDKECEIFAVKGDGETQKDIEWTALYRANGIPVTEEQLRKCVLEFLNDM